MFMSGAMKGLTPDDITDSQRTSLAFKAALIGGGACLLTGGNFLKGALFGYNIAMFNYAEGFPAEDYYDKDGNKYTELYDVIVTAKVSKGFLDFKGQFNLWNFSISNENLFIDSYGNSLKTPGTFSTSCSSNMQSCKLSVQRPIINQYTTQKFTTIGKGITTYSGTATYVIGGLQIGFGVAQDTMDYNNYGYTNAYNTIRAAVSFGSAWAGMEAGLYMGAIIGSYFGGVGAIPGSIIGAAVYGVILGYWGGEVGGQAVDQLYGK